MTNYKQIFFGACLMLLLNSGSAFSAASPGKSPSPQSSLFDAPLAASASTTQIAGVYWLPDFLKSNTGRTETCEGANCGNKDPQRTCEKYGYASACASPKEYSSIKSPIPGMTCYQNCHCPSKFQYTTANCKDSEGKMTDGVVCEGKAEKCICQPKVTVGTGEKCDLSCGGNCVKKSCKPGVSVGTGEQCNERCASNSSICTAKSCKATVSVGTGERCTENCATGGACTAKACKSSVSVGTGEQCNERCASNSSICTAKGCKASKSVPSGYTCTEKCASNSSICTATGCVSTAGYQSCSCGGYNGSVYSCGKTYYKNCSSCCAYSCSLSSCPSGGNCSYESCSGKYCLNSCQSGYKKSGNSCVASCPNGYVSTRMSSCPKSYDGVTGRIVSSNGCYTCMYDYGNVYYTMTENENYSDAMGLNNKCCDHGCVINMKNFEPKSGGGPCSRVVWNISGHIYCTYREPYTLGLDYYLSDGSYISYGSKDDRILIRSK